MDFFGILFDMKNGSKIPYSKTYFDTLLADNLAGVTTLTGTLPLTFTTSETTLRSWTIYGADIEHIETASGKSITFYTDEDRLRDWTIYGNIEGVGERTKNILDISSFADVDQNNVVMTLNADNATISVYTTDIPTAQTQGLCNFEVSETGNYLLSGIPTDAPNIAVNAYIWDRDASGRAKAWDKITDMDTCNKNNQSVEVYLEQGVRYQLRVRVQASYGKHEEPVIVSPMVRKSNTTADFIPYGYQIPITVSQTGQTDKNYDIFIGDSPLTEGESVNKTSTGVDIATADGNNTITTSLYNQPDMSITYNEFTGVGERTKNLFNKNACELLQIDTEGTMKFGTQLDVKGGAQYTLINTNPRNVDIYILVHSENLNRYQSTQIRTSPVRFIMPSGYKAYLRTDDDVLTDWDTIGVTDIALYEGNLTNPSFVPYGYKIPLTITLGQQTTDYDIFIGDAPLTDGQSVTDTLTINTFEGENVLDTTLENKPQMSITYKGG